MWKNDKELFSRAKTELFVALVGDVLDTLGYQHQFLPPEIKPLNDNHVIIGRAMPVLETDYFTTDSKGNNPLTSKPFGLMFEALDDLKEDEIYICSGSSPTYALWGGLMSTRALKCKSAGAIVNGYHRDTNEIKRLDFPIASMGSYAQDQGVRGKVLDWRVPIKISGITINPGDIIYADLDGVLVVPKEVEKQAFEGAFKKSLEENKVLEALQQGMTTVQAFEKFGIM